jgi:nicotinate-nucleotide pyrophosphorylase (carboxylating)
MPVEERLSDLTQLARAALDEDAPTGDITTALTVPYDATCRGELVARGSGVIAGIRSFAEVVEQAAIRDGTLVSVDEKLADGDPVHPGDVVAVVAGPARTVLRAERPAINLISHLSGVATLTRRFVDAASPASILCTRKTLPGLRELERQAVLAGRGGLHRATLSDAVLIKDNHVRLAGGVGSAVRRARAGTSAAIEVEVTTLEELDEALEAGADRVLLDNATPELVREAVARVEDPRRLEVSGGITLDNVRAFVDAGARTISVGRLTHSAPALDLALEVTDGD